jgi:hypothetical protein
VAAITVLGQQRANLALEKLDSTRVVVRLRYGRGGAHRNQECADPGGFHVCNHAPLSKPYEQRIGYNRVAAARPPLYLAVYSHAAGYAHTGSKS